MNHDSIIRLGFFFILLCTFMTLEYIYPRRVAEFPRRIRWPINFSLTAFNSVLMSLMPVTAVGMAMYGEQHATGLMQHLPVPRIWAITFGIIWLDFIIYCQHRLFHRVPALWRLHILHHTDGNLDASSALRFHPIEIAVSLAIKIVAILVMGVPPLAVMIFEIILNGMALFNHSNLRMPETLEVWLRKAVVTPDMHRIHHSQLPQEMHSNFGFNLSLWDKLFHSYTAAASKATFLLGIAHIPFEQQKKPLFLLALPFAAADIISGVKHE